MDLRLSTVSPSDAERAAVDAVLGAPPATAPTLSALEAKRRRPHLLPVLVSLQRRVGHISQGGMGYACERLGVPPAEAFGVASFYALLSLGERPASFAHVCDDLACAAAGANTLCQQLDATLGPAAGHAHRAEAAGHGQATPARWAKSPCLGLCEQAPAAMVTVAREKPLEQAFGGATLERIQKAMAGEPVPQLPLHFGGEGPQRLLARAGKYDPESLDAYRAIGGFAALSKALTIGPAAVIAEVSGAKLVGRGGAAFPTGRKWDAVAKATGAPKYVVCNADESEPGTFKDRVLLELDPFAVVEAMTLAGFATGADKGFIYIRGEYPLCIARIENAVYETRKAGHFALPGRIFDIEVRRGAGAYICGEETALFASIEGYRGEPRSKPPFPVHQGLFQKPTAINNVETLVATLDIVRDGAASYAQMGTPGSPGTKLFCVSGKLQKPGIYEVPFGTKLDRLIELAGGVAPGRKISGVLLGGAAGTFLNPSQLGVQLSFEHTREAGTTLGSGVVFVLDDSVALLPLLRRIAEFFRDESCGQCVPCRVGTVRQEELLSRLARGAPLGSAEQEQAMYAELSQAMKDASICGLGQTASSAIESAFKNLKVAP
jgi:NADH-quinone oxidoreductase subunit F